MAGGFDETDQFKILIVDPGDLTTELQNPGILYVALSRRVFSLSLLEETAEREWAVSSSLVESLITPKVVTPGKDNCSSKSFESTKFSTEDRLKCAAIDWFSPTMVTAELLKYESDEDKIPKVQEDQLELLMQKFKLDNLKATYYMIAGKIGANEDSVLLPYNAGAKIVIPIFIAMIYDHRSMMYDRFKDAKR